MAKSKRNKPPTAADHLAAMKEGRWLPVDLSQLGEVGTVPGPDVRATLELASAYAAAEDPDYVSVSWDCQKRAQEFYNANGLGPTLDEIVRVGGSLVSSEEPE
jgi:hypothetical protein